jgi:predicted dehydrogenase
MGKTISVGVIGIGFGQQVHVPAFRSDPRCVVHAIAASQLDRAQKVATKLEIPVAYGDAGKLINDPQIQIVSIAVPPTHQPALIEAVARAGKHVFCEKPVGAELAGAAKAFDAVKKAGVRHAIDLLFPEIPAWQHAKDLLPSVGALRQVAISWRVETYAYKTGATSWKTRAGDGGGTLGNFVSHCAYYIEWLLGPVARLSARLTPAPTADRGEARVDAWLETASGVPVGLSVAADAFLGSGHRVEIYGDQGSIHLVNPTSDYINGFELLLGTRTSGKLEQRVGPKLDGGDGRITVASSIIHRFVDAVESGGDVRPGLEEGVRVQRMLDAMRASHDASGQWQKI